MKFLIIFFLPLLINCDCFYKGSYSKVEWDENNERYIPTTMELGEINIIPNFEYCRKSNKYLQIKGKIFNNAINKNKNILLNEEILVIRCDKNGHIIENVSKITKQGNFDIKFLKKLKNVMAISTI